MFRPVICSLASILMLLTLSCTDDHYITNKNIIDERGVIVGRVMSDETGVQVSAWLSSMVASTVADADGHFALRDLLPGVYEIRFESPDGASTRKSHCLVEDGSVTYLGEVYLYNLVWPIVSVSPPQDATIEVGTDIYFVSKSKVRLSSPASAVSFTPSLNGTWHESYHSYEESYWYMFAASDILVGGQEYALSISPSLEFEDGETLGQGITSSFTVAPFRISSYDLIDNSHSVDPLVSSALLYLRFSQHPDPASIRDHISISPPVAINVYTYSYGMEYMVSTEEALRPGQSYRITVSSDLTAIDGSTLGEDAYFDFTVAPLRVESFGVYAGYYGESSTLLDPEDANSGTMRMRFNAPVDSDALNAAVTYDFPLDGVWLLSESGYYYDPYYWLFVTDPATYEPESQYTVTISGSADLGDGVTLGQDEDLVFRTKPLRIESVNPNNGSTSAYRWTDITVDFNCQMNQPATEISFSLTTYDGTPVEGTFSWQPSNTLEFDPTDALVAGEIYRVSVSTTAQTLGGHHLAESFESLFIVGN